MSKPISDELLREAIDRIARTPDGPLLYLYLQRRLMAFSPAASNSALRSDNGERSFAAKLIGLMAKGISESGRAGPSSGGSEQPIVFPVAKPVPSRIPRGAGRRIGPEDRVAGWDPPEGT
jgi:hypothetical protein